MRLRTALACLLPPPLAAATRALGGIAVLPALLLLAGCGAPLDAVEMSATGAEDSWPIVGGSPCMPGEFPAVGALITKGVVTFGDPPESYNTGDIFCTGALIASDVVLTAAHCTEVEATIYGGVGEQMEHYFTLSRDVRDFRGEWVVPPESYRISTFVHHPEYDRAGFDLFPEGLASLKDVGLVFLEEPVSGVLIDTVMEEDDDSFIALEAELDIVGYGLTQLNGSTGLKSAARSHINEINDTEIQVGDELPTPVQCLGDSGGPSYMVVDDGKEPRLRLVAITSRSYDETLCQLGGIDTRTDAYRAWIESTMVAACSNGVRSHCSGGGGLAAPIDYRDAGPGGDAGAGADDAASAGDDAGDDAPASGCACAGSERHARSWVALSLGLAFMLGRRRSS